MFLFVWIRLISYEGYKSPQKQVRMYYASLLGRIICYFLVKAHLPPYHNRSTSFILLQIKVCRYFLHSLLSMKFCKRTFQGYSSKLNKSREKSFCLSKRKKEKTMNPNNLSRDHHRDKYNSVAWKENSQNSCFLVKKSYSFEDIFNVLLGYIKFTSLSILFFVGTF